MKLLKLELEKMVDAHEKKLAGIALNYIAGKYDKERL